MLMVLFLYRSIRSTASVSVIPTAAVVPPPPAPTAPWKTQACVLTTVTTAAAKPAMQRPTDRCGQADRPTLINNRTHKAVHTPCDGSPFTHQSDHCWASTICSFSKKRKANLPVWQNDLTCFQCKSACFNGMKPKINFHESNDAIWPFQNTKGCQNKMNGFQNKGNFLTLLVYFPCFKGLLSFWGTKWV